MNGLAVDVHGVGTGETRRSREKPIPCDLAGALGGVTSEQVARPAGVAPQVVRSGRARRCGGLFQQRAQVGPLVAGMQCCLGRHAAHPGAGRAQRAMVDQNGGQAEATQFAESRETGSASSDDGNVGGDGRGHARGSPSLCLRRGSRSRQPKGSTQKWPGRWTTARGT
ncbi:hypothetical protein SDC9_103768 [bioreactor metagenome]|uniref:Uncharacterized protein n=1 Tax=bioreactor metagenome TaxID=1076179 RepID=A0A645AXC0_9ZZZZ